MARPPIFAPDFTWERKPFKKCERCGEIAFGFLSAGRDTMTERCSQCRHTINWALPEVNKRVVYLDQFAFSMLFNVHVKSGRLPKGHEAFAQECYSKVKRAVLLQQAVFPYSDLHSQETIVFYDPAGLRDLYQHIGGDMPLMRAASVEIMQIGEFACAYRDRREPVLNFSPDEVLEKPRNDWLPDMRVRVNADYRRFAGGIRHRRDKNHEEMAKLYERWKQTKPTYEQALQTELSCFGSVKWEVYWKRFGESIEAEGRGDMNAYLNAMGDPIFDEKLMLQEVLAPGRNGDPIEELRSIREFWHWERNIEIPAHAIACRFWAALAHRFGGRQTKSSRGASTDIRAISVYGPYVDAMFVDREFAGIIRERPDIREFLNARIFSFSNTDEFLAYLDELADGASDEVREYAERIYGVK